ncbi:MAG: hypothetical protein ATN35_12765 [Epulopiscium sp. Nele67-Bin004]|nr:MAG: hypothetical protein ATN35_12765 [Epulopiscium sp. Nele67-Bin004]
MENIFGERLAMLLKRHRKTQKEVATAVGIAPTTLSRYTSGERFPPSIVIVDIAQHLDTTADFLLGLDKAAPNDFEDLKAKAKYCASHFTPQQKLELITILSAV